MVPKISKEELAKVKEAALAQLRVRIGNSKVGPKYCDPDRTKLEPAVLQNLLKVVFSSLDLKKLAPIYWGEMDLFLDEVREEFFSQLGQGRSAQEVVTKMSHARGVMSKEPWVRACMRDPQSLMFIQRNMMFETVWSEIKTGRYIKNA